MVQVTLAASLIFDIDGTLWVHFALFFVLLFIMNRLFYKPYLSLKTRRVSETKDKLILADVYRTGTQKLSRECEEIVDRAKRDAYEERRRIRAKAVKAAEHMKAEADRESDRMLYDNERKMDAEIAVVRRKLESQVPQYARMLALRLLGRKE